MTGIIVGGSARSLLTHMALYGLAAICENAGHTDLRLSRTPGMNPQARIDLDLDDNDIAQLVHTHAEQHASPEAWPQERLHIKGSDRGLMSPRIAALTHTGTQAAANHIPDNALWDELQQRRHRVIDHLTHTRQELDLRLLAALGEPCYWRLHADSAQPGRYQDDGASRLEMQPRNQGSEFVGNRLSKVAKKVAERDVQTVRDGLLGLQILDEAGTDKPDSRSATGMAEPGPADNAIVWCALWGISQTPLTLRTTERARTSICLSVNRREHFYTPYGGDHSTPPGCAPCSPAPRCASPPRRGSATAPQPPATARPLSNG
jgi:CRISPR-associated protein Csb3